VNWRIVYRYEAAKGKGEYDEEAQKRENAKHALERYMHYYQRWAENDKSRKEALVKMKQAQSHILEKLSTLYTTPTSQLKFILDAWSQVPPPPPPPIPLAPPRPTSIPSHKPALSHDVNEPPQIKSWILPFQ
jgi:hypothetical protein